MRDRKQKSVKKARQGGGYTGRETRERRGGIGEPRFSVGAGKIFAYPLDLPPPISAARFLDIGSGVSIFRSFASRSDFRTESLLFPPLHSIPYPFLSLLSPFSFISGCAPVSLSFSSALSLCLSLFSLSSFHENDSHPLALFFSLAQCASENMNPSSHCLRQRFSNFPPLCANDEGTKREIKSRSQ